MRTVTTTREYDDQGQCVKEVVADDLGESVNTAALADLRYAICQALVSEAAITQHEPRQGMSWAQAFNDFARRLASGEVVPYKVSS